MKKSNSTWLESLSTVLIILAVVGTTVGIFAYEQFLESGGGQDPVAPRAPGTARVARSAPRGGQRVTASITCREFVDFLMDHFEGSLDAEVRSTFEGHMDDCPSCVTYLADQVTNGRS